MDKLPRYNLFSTELKKEFGQKVQRISVDAGFTCPNRDGRLAVGGCVFCGGNGSGSHGIKRNLTIQQQIEDGKEVMIRKYRANKFIAYFQAYSNTYDKPEKLNRLYRDALTVKDVVGIIVATRPDCLDDNIIECLAELHKDTYLWLEIGMQSMYDRTLDLIKRGHDYECTVNAVKRVKDSGIRVCVHIILGLPGESKSQMLAMADELNRIGVDGVKIQLLHVMRGTELHAMYERGEFELLERDEYAGLVCDFVERLDPAILIHRLTGDGGHDNLVAPLWSLKKFEVLNLIDREFALRNTRQGSNLSSNYK